MYGLSDMLDIPQQNPLKYGFSGIEVVVVNEQWRSEAVTICGDLGIQFVTGNRFPGGFLRSHSERDEYVMSKVCK